MVINQPINYDEAEFQQFLQEGPGSFATWKNKVIKTEYDKLNDRIAKLEEANQRLIDGADSEIAANYIKKPSSTHDEYDIMLGRLNPDLKKKSDRYDQNLMQKSILENEKVNLSKAEELLHSAVNKQVGAANTIADESLKANAMNKALAQWGAMWIAGKSWATAGQMSAVQNEIANKFAPERGTIESQRQAAIAAAWQQEMGIPAQIAWLNSEQATADYNRSLIKSSAATSYNNPLRTSPKTTPLTDAEKKALLNAQRAQNRANSPWSTYNGWKFQTTLEW